jgi:RNA polymerase sigma-70 factor (ECF subfamily)
LGNASNLGHARVTRVDSGLGGDDARIGRVGAFLRSAFASAATQPLPPAFVDLLDRLAAAEAAAGQRQARRDEAFKTELAGIIPQLRAYARSLAGNRDSADDLVQETLLKAWAARVRFEAGTNIRAWTFIILRNIFLSQVRRARFKGEWDEIAADRLLSAPAGQDKRIELSDLERGLAQLPQAQRDAIILVGAGGFSYDEAAAICDCAVGTIKSRVARGRAALEAMIAEGRLPSRRTDAAESSSPLDSIMRQVDELSAD